ncbi:hypothetical protein TorRG33x02_353380, partial [Trema orientale]
METLEHRLFWCKNLKILWKRDGIWSLVEDKRNCTIPDLLLCVYRNVSKELFELVGVTLWNIWYQRNMKVHGGDWCDLSAPFLTRLSSMSKSITLPITQQLSHRIPYCAPSHLN